MTKKQVLEAIEQEINWHIKNARSPHFLMGLRRAYCIVREMKIDRVIDNKKRSHKKKI